MFHLHMLNNIYSKCVFFITVNKSNINYVFGLYMKEKLLSKILIWFYEINKLQLNYVAQINVIMIWNGLCPELRFAFEMFQDRKEFIEPNIMQFSLYYQCNQLPVYLYTYLKQKCFNDILYHIIFCISLNCCYRVSICKCPKNIC